ncbi:MAG: alpha/beta fold hydrolase [Anaerolineaceae bacterium]|nr:alpha/beta fold hydrolase [Anaerolineaceae bacterium]
MIKHIYQLSLLLAVVLVLSFPNQTFFSWIGFPINNFAASQPKSNQGSADVNPHENIFTKINYKISSNLARNFPSFLGNPRYDLITSRILSNNPSDWLIYDTSNSGLPDDYVRTVAFDNQGICWFGTAYSGIATFDGSKWKLINTTNSGLKSNTINMIMVDNDGTIWAGTDAGAAHFDGKNWIIYNMPGNNQVTVVTKDSHGTKWFGTWGGGVDSYDGSVWTHYLSGYIRGIAFDQDGAIWVGGIGGVNVYDGTKWTNFTTSNSGLPSNDIMTIVIGTDGTKWIGTNGGGLTKFDGLEWTIYNTANSLIPDNQVSPQFIDSDKSLWIGTGGGIANFDGTNWTILTTSNSKLSASNIGQIAEDKKENIWVTTYGGGVNRFPDTLIPHPAAITGKVTDISGTPIPGISISSSSGTNVITDSTGAYTFTGLAAGPYTITPTSSDYQFSPTSRIVKVPPSMTGQNFTATMITYPIILLPGIMGSRLSNAPTCPSRPSGEIWVQQLMDNIPDILTNFSTLTLITDSNGNPYPQNPCDQIYASGIMDSGLNTNIYGNIVTALNSDDYPIYTFPYDWRLSLENNAKLLDIRVEEIRNVTGAKKVILLGHSMGGLVARQYISAKSWASKVDKVISVGSPYWGAPQAADVMREGKTGIKFVDYFSKLLGKTITDMVRNSPGSMELLPSRAYFQQSPPYYQINGKSFSSYDGTTQYFKSNGQNPILLDIAQNFHDRVDDFTNLNGVSYFVLAANHDWTPTVFNEKPCESQTGICDTAIEYDLGDGTVPITSARAGIAGAGNGSTHMCTMKTVDSGHTDLMNDPTVQGLVEKILDNRPLSSSDCQEIQTDSASKLSASSSGTTPTAFIEVVVQGSGKVSVEDASNNIAKVGDDGVITNAIPSATYELLDQTTTLTLPTTSTYTLTLLQNSTDPDEVRVTDFRNLSNPEDFDPYQRAVFVDVPSTVGGIATLAIDYINGVSSLQLLLDKNGNGTIDQTLPPTSVLNQTQSQDYTPPVTTIQNSGSKNVLGFYTGPVTATLTATDVGTGVYKTEFSLDDGITWQTYTTPVQFIAEKVTTFYSRSVDFAGNQEYPYAKTWVSAKYFYIPLIN